MNRILQITRILALLFFASFASNAMSMTIGSVVGDASLDGNWSYLECLTACDKKLDTLDAAFEATAMEDGVLSQETGVLDVASLDAALEVTAMEDGVAGSEALGVRAESEVTEVPLPPASWLFGTAMLAYVGHWVRAKSN